MDTAVAFYSENATMLKTCFTELGFETFGGANAPYVLRQEDPGGLFRVVYGVLSLIEFVWGCLGFVEDWLGFVSGLFIVCLAVVVCRAV